MITKKEAIEMHRKMWNYIASESLRCKIRLSKKSFLELHDAHHKYMKNQCYCCEYTTQGNVYKRTNCSDCPLEWGSNAHRYMCEKLSKRNREGNLYGQWNTLSCNKYEKAAEIAKRIAELPERQTLTLLDVATELFDGIYDESVRIPFIINGLKAVMKEDKITLNELREICRQDSDAIINRIM